MLTTSFTFIQCQSFTGEARTWSVRLFFCVTPAVPYMRRLGCAGALQERAGCSPLPNGSVDLWVLGRTPLSGAPLHCRTEWCCRRSPPTNDTYPLKSSRTTMFIFLHLIRNIGHYSVSPRKLRVRARMVLGAFMLPSGRERGLSLSNKFCIWFCQEEYLPEIRTITGKSLRLFFSFR